MTISSIILWKILVDECTLFIVLLITNNESIIIIIIAEPEHYSYNSHVSSGGTSYYLCKEDLSPVNSKLMGGANMMMA